jgi:hypothetical protein
MSARGWRDAFWRDACGANPSVDYEQFHDLALRACPEDPHLGRELIDRALGRTVDVLEIDEIPVTQINPWFAQPATEA